MHRVQQRTRVVPEYIRKQEMARAQLGNNIADHMEYIFAIILYDKFDLSFKQITNFYNKTVARRFAWQDDDNDKVTSEDMLAYCFKKKIDVIGFVKSVPMSQKLYMADIQKGRAVIGAERNIDHAFLSTFLLVMPVLKESYKFSNAKIEEFMQWVAYFIDSYCRKQPGCKDHYLNDDMIRQIFIDEENWDIVEGKKVV
jgi:hypothetical protein